ncbi:MAG TPA: membrane protein insertion efficiency factor YidD [Methylomirabilota bacterium]|jgi:putative component of membrane protein insertase Oxa1/YidC/SpoIIIJ protein YidD|nr:membrane protein insertion efficiency factor YidD [Methylomirabilota bacterium]
MEILKTISRILSLPLLLVVWLYQRTFSPDHGLFKSLFPYGYCKFYPSCSEYGRLVLKEQGILGLPKIIKRVLSCRPSASPQIDQP